MNEKIKKCPHCGATAWFEPWVSEDCNDVYTYIECNGCGCGTRQYGNTDKDIATMIETWNKRVIDDKYNELVEFIKSMIIPSCGYLLPRLTCDAEELLRKHGINV